MQRSTRRESARLFYLDDTTRSDCFINDNKLLLLTSHSSVHSQTTRTLHRTLYLNRKLYPLNEVNLRAGYLTVNPMSLEKYSSVCLSIVIVTVTFTCFSHSSCITTQKQLRQLITITAYIHFLTVAMLRETLYAVFPPARPSARPPARLLATPQLSVFSCLDVVK